MPKNLISIRDFSKDEILHILDLAKEFEANREQNFLAGKIVACLFFEPSTRTRLSFEAAVNRLGARVIGFPDNRNTSQSKGETLEDTIKIVSNYADMIIMRHPQTGAADIAASVASVPVVNAGDGINQHPSQTLLDLYAIKKTQGRLEDLNIDMVGDLKYGRAVHSLVDALMDFNPTFTFTSPDELLMPRKYIEMLDEKKINYKEVRDIEAGLNECDILYMTRVQRERFPEISEYDKVKDSYRLTASMLGSVKPSMKVLHPLPRVNEIATDVDDTQYAYYFQQAGGGMYIRMAIISYLLGYK
ncbi:MAG: aspartate carbamoyltransferase [Bacteroidales bacterium]|nr:aspartate carbamoyltransferase [Bacteroidales bacterium]